MIKFHNWLEGKILAHIAGASGSGKTTLANKLSTIYPNIIFKDLDDFDDEAVALLNWTNIRKNDYTDKMLFDLAKLRQQLMDNFIKSTSKSIIFVGHHTEGDNVLYIPTKNKFLLNVDAKTSAFRAYQRSQNEDPKYRRTLEDLPSDEKEAQEVINWLLKSGYKSLTHDQILQWMKNYS